MCRRAGSRCSRGCLDPGGEQERGRPLARRRRLACGGERGEQALRAARVAEDDPRPAEPVGDREPSHGVVGRAPGQRGVDVGALGAREREVLGLLRAAHALRRRGGLLRVPRGMRVEAALGEPRLGQRLERERADAVEQPVAGRLVHDHERAAREPAHDVDRRLRRHVERAEHRLGRRERRAAGEGGQRPEAALVVGEQQVVAPADRRPQRPAALGLAARRVAQHGEAVVEPARDLLDGQRPRARRGELDRERQAVERPAQLAHLARGRPAGRSAARRARPRRRAPAERARTRPRPRARAVPGSCRGSAAPAPRRAGAPRAPRRRRPRARSCRGSAPPPSRRRRSCSAASPPTTPSAAMTVSSTSSAVCAPSSRTSQTGTSAACGPSRSRAPSCRCRPGRRPRRGGDAPAGRAAPRSRRRAPRARLRATAGCPRARRARSPGSGSGARSPSAAGPARGRARPRGGCGRAGTRPARRPAGPRGRGR